MSNTRSEETRTEAVGVFHDADSLVAAIDELLSSGFDRSEVTLLADEKTVAQKLGHAYEKVAELEDELAVPRAAYVSTEALGEAAGGLIGGLFYVGATAAAGAMIASGGTLAAAIAAAAMAGGAGGLIGSVLAQLVGDQQGRYLREQIDHGGLLLWVRTWDKAHERRAVDILSKHAADDVHTHALRQWKT